MITWTFFFVSVIAACVHRYSGNHQKCTITFLLLGGVTLWMREDWEQMPHIFSADTQLVIWTVLQAIFAGIAFYVRDIPVEDSHRSSGAS
ncbi:Uncharacterised protein [Streptococcus pneumoniae]|jgi:hypothetical protein|uniref:Uncharacterized protein n=2 Tax=Stutzerimonas TaxID=2901164 RepID=A0A162HS54_STUST|nr:MULTISPECIES: hypothetical protein [Stutzerimonas]WAD28906.1 hypothetical protein OS670_20695 [Pseudomonadaceae bacterium T75]CJL78055.1 Uncharacterised protein [Streptococcus pneumoniae]KZX56663.1 hypothetical protein A3710_21830 [Stutzerimonas frequens]MBH3355275.1 hypothetical protein [Stutzerimonas stutzeri]MDH0084174.1 hypothetical protein [Stutzerimonas stutzeri]